MSNNDSTVPKQCSEVPKPANATVADDPQAPPKRKRWWQFWRSEVGTTQPPVCSVA